MGDDVTVSRYGYCRCEENIYMKKIYAATIAVMLFFVVPVNVSAQEADRSVNTAANADDDDDDSGKWGLAGLLGLLGLAGLTRRKDNDRDVRLPRTDR